MKSSQQRPIAHRFPMPIDEPPIRKPSRTRTPFPVTEGIGIFVGVIAWDLLNDGYVAIDKAFFISVPCSLLWFAWRCWKNRTQ